MIHENPSILWPQQENHKDCLSAAEPTSQKTEIEQKRKQSGNLSLSGPTWRFLPSLLSLNQSPFPLNWEIRPWIPFYPWDPPNFLRKLSSQCPSLKAWSLPVKLWCLCSPSISLPASSNSLSLCISLHPHLPCVWGWSPLAILFPLLLILLWDQCSCSRLSSLAALLDSHLAHLHSFLY